LLELRRSAWRISSITEGTSWCTTRNAVVITDRNISGTFLFNNLYANVAVEPIYLNALTVISLRRPLVVHFFVELVLLVCVSIL